MNPETDRLGAGYHIIQSQIAIGSGGVFGKGYMNGSQAQLEFLPERSTDFIFAVIGEEFGLLGQLLILTLYGVVIGRALYLAMQGQDTFARLTGGAIALELLRLCVRQFRHGERHPAGGRRAAAPDQLRRHLHGDPAGRLRHPDVAAFAPQAHRLLSMRAFDPCASCRMCARRAAGAWRQPAAAHRHQAQRRQGLHRAHGEHYAFKKRPLRKLLKSAQSQPAIIEAMDKPAEKAKLWFEYRPIFLTERRIQRRHGVLARASPGARSGQRPAAASRPEYLAAILGVETYYGRLTGTYRVLDALSRWRSTTRARAKFFRDELEQYLLLTRDAHLDPLTLKGSYAGAMGAPQFMPSNYRRYAVDADADGRIDLWSNWAGCVRQRRQLSQGTRLECRRAGARARPR